ncbi:MAG TPA: hypothetical protein DDW52_06625 [Planctomycetaceae bacterium]|nr:hypothetical protein [Planctomycetaceae bacterium]
MSERRSELEEFKKRIDLREYAVSVGFELIRKQSSRHSSVMKHANGDKIVVARMPWDHYVYFNVHAGSSDDSGSIIDFVQARDNCSLGEVRKKLRGWTHSSFSGVRRPTPLLPSLEPSTQDAARVFASWTKARLIESHHGYLIGERCIPAATIGDPKFAGRLRSDFRGNALFAHHNAGGLCGYEVKNREFTGFSPGGLKGLMFSRPDADDETMVISETAIDMLSVAALEGTSGRRFFSLAGQPSPAQISLLQSAAKKMPSNKPTALFAVDNDDAGRRMAKFLRSALLPFCSEVLEHLPPVEGQDWNDVLKAQHIAMQPDDRKTCSPHPR